MPPGWGASSTGFCLCPQTAQDACRGTDVAAPAERRRGSVRPPTPGRRGGPLPKRKFPTGGQGALFMNACCCGDELCPQASPNPPIVTRSVPAHAPVSSGRTVSTLPELPSPAHAQAPLPAGRAEDQRFSGRSMGKPRAASCSSSPSPGGEASVRAHGLDTWQIAREPRGSDGIELGLQTLASFPLSSF